MNANYLELPNPSNVVLSLDIISGKKFKYVIKVRMRKGIFS